MAKNMPVATEPGRPGVDRTSSDAGGLRNRFARLAGPRSNHPELEPVPGTRTFRVETKEENPA